MCIAVPGKLIQIDGHRGRVNIRGNILTVELGLVDACVGDFLLIHAGCALSVLKKTEAEELDGLLAQVNDDDGNT